QGRNTGPGQLLELDLVIGELVLIIDDGKDILLAHVPRSDHFLDQLLEPDRVALREDADEVERLPRPVFLAATENAEIVRAGLDHVPPLAEVAVNEETPEEIALVGKLGKEGVEREVFECDLLPVEKVEGLLRGEPQSLRVQPPVPALLVQCAPFLPEAY